MAEISRRVWVVEEVEINNETAQRQSMVFCNEDTQNNHWYWPRPDDRLNDAQRAEWDRIMGLLKNVHGEDLRHVVCAVGLMDHCFNPSIAKDYVDPSDDRHKKN